METIKKYYELIDSNNLDDVLKLFSKNIIYLRNDLKINGLDELRGFFKNKRNLVGKHVGLNFFKRKDSILIEGRFIGLSGEKKVDFSFIDEFWLDKRELIIKRISKF